MYTLMIVDDDELIRKGLEKVIQWEKMGFRVQAAFGNAREALDYVRTHPVDVVLTDIKMPEMTGLELIGEVKKLRPGTKAVIISGYGDFELTKQALLLKVEDYLLKPLGEEDVETAFLKLRKNLDAEQKKDTKGSREVNIEYELMKKLDARVRMVPLFAGNGRREYEMVLVRLECREGGADCEEQLIACEEMVLQGLRDCFCCHQDGWMVSLVPPAQLNGILMYLKREFPKYRCIFCQVLIGRQVYSEAEVLSSYWSVVNLAHEEKQSGVIHYERARSVYKREWDAIREQKDKIIENLENGRFQEIDAQVARIRELLAHYDSKDVYYFYCDIVTKILKYFDMEERGAACLFSNRQIADAGMRYPEKEQLERNFRQDMDVICKALWENSDSMRNLMVSKAKAMIQEEYADKDLSLASVANRLNISYGYLSTIFTKAVGISFKTYLVEVRMEKARTLLLSRNYRIYEIAEMIGYKNPRYFTDAFKKYYHYSPADYIARFRGGAGIDGTEPGGDR